MVAISTAAKLAKRCERVGWRVEQTRVGFRVHPPMQLPLVIHLTPKGHGYYKTIERKLTEYGLVAAEERLAGVRQKEREERIAADRAENARRAKLIQDQNRALVRASYAGLSFTDDIQWALTPSPVPRDPKVTEITPDMAKAMLERNTHNRPVSDSKKRKHIRTLLDGRWLLTHQGIAFDTNGVLLDGQTRLKAIVESGVTAAMWVFIGQPPENFHAIDRTRPRNAANALDHIGIKGNGTQRSAYARLILAAQDGTINGRFRPTHDDDEVLRLWESELDFHRDCFNQGMRVAKTGAAKARDGLFVYSAVGAAICLIKKANNARDERGNYRHWAMIDQWFEQVETGENLSAGDARLALRKYMMDNRKLRGFDNRGQLMLFIDAWNNTLEGTFTTYLKWAPTRTFPRITAIG